MGPWLVANLSYPTLSLRSSVGAIVLTPVPEPTTYGLLLAGLGLLALRSRRTP